MPATPSPARSTATDAAIGALLRDAAAAHPELELHSPSSETIAYLDDSSTLWARSTKTARDGAASRGPAVALPTTTEEVQTLVRLAGRHGVTVVPRGSGTGLVGGATSYDDQLVISTARLTRIVEVSELDQVAIVEAGVLNADLNAHLAPLGLFYAPDPASWDISSIGGNIATNAGGLRCVKYGVTRESVLALDVVLADGSLISVGHRSIKGVTGLDLVSLFVGSEGALGIVVRATVRIRRVPVARRTVAAYFSGTAAGAAGLAAITRSRVQPSIIEFLDAPSVAHINEFSETPLGEPGDSVVLIELDGFGIDEQLAELDTALTSAGARVQAAADAEAVRLWDLRRRPRRERTDVWTAASDVAVPKSRIPELFAHFDEITRRYGVGLSAIAHAGDGNLHPLFTLPRPADVDAAAPAPAILHDAAEALARFALTLGGTITGEHGIGSTKHDLAALELSERTREVQLAIKAALDPTNLLNPGKAI